MATEQLIEQTADTIEEVAEATRGLTGRELGFFGVGAGLGIALGFAVGFRIAEKRMKLKYQNMAVSEIAKMREHYMQKTVAAQPKPPVETVTEKKTRRPYTEAEQQAINEVVEAEEKLRESLKNETSSDEWDYKYEISQRVKHVPYIIHHDEFLENAPSHDQVSYTYYEVDDMLSDTRDTTIDDIDAVIGLGNLGRWGHGSPGDQNCVYIRNEKLGMDFEVVRDRGSFSDSVRGTIRHSSDRRRRPKHRGFDDEETDR